MNKKIKMKRLFLQALKIAVGSSVAIYVAEALDLRFAASAGSIALLSIVTTKWETFKLSFYRIFTFLIAVILAWIMFAHLHSEWIAYGLFIFLIVFFSDILGWKSTVSVNAVIGTHFLTELDFSKEFIINEFLIVFIGITIAIVFNLFHDNRGHRNEIIKNMRFAEAKLQMILQELAAYLLSQPGKQNVWDDIVGLEKELHYFLELAQDYQNNTFQSHPAYYIDYFEMRIDQCHILHNLHYEIKRIRTMPKQAAVIAKYILYMRNYVIETNSPIEQLEKLHQIFEKMKQEPLPESQEEFEGRAMLYHILMDLEDFLIFKRRFVEALDYVQLRRYWSTKGE